jgi:hypothetical protein
MRPKNRPVGNTGIVEGRCTFQVTAGRAGFARLPAKPTLTKAPEHESAFLFKRNEEKRRQNCFPFIANKKEFFPASFASQVAKKSPKHDQKEKKDLAPIKKSFYKEWQSLGLQISFSQLNRGLITMCRHRRQHA